jgi:hypothetical protein
VYHATAGGTMNDAATIPSSAPLSMKITIVFTGQPPPFGVQPRCQRSRFLTVPERA